MFRFSSRQSFSTLAVLAVTAMMIPGVNGYASWLQCYVDLDTSEVVMNYPILRPDKAPFLVEVEMKLENDEHWTTDPLTYPADQKSKVLARLKVPEALKREDVQYVVEATEGGTFVKPTMCEGHRSHGRRYYEPVELEVDGTADQVQVWAGWATGHEAVSLTPKAILYKQGTSPRLSPEL